MTLLVTAVSGVASIAGAGVTFHVTLSGAKPTATRAATGRLIVAAIRDGPGDTRAKLPADATPNDAPFWDDPQPMFALDVPIAEIAESASDGWTIDDACDASMIAPGSLPPGQYRAQARLITTRTTSDWRRDAGNLVGPAVAFTVAESASPSPVGLVLSESTKVEHWTPAPGVELVEIRSAVLSQFHGRDVMLRAGVVKPTAFDPARVYPAVYEVPGFGGDHRGADHVAGARAARASSADAARGDEAALDRAAFWIVLDPESPNGHTLFADSANNGPCGKALVDELVPAIEAKYHLVAKPQARLLRGHSSGGWSTLWLALTYPETFGATWSTSPDPVDFRALEQINIYTDANAFTTTRDGKPVELCSFRKDSKEIMTVRQEVVGERMFGGRQTSGQQWASWQAVWGPRVTDPATGRPHPAALFDDHTGVIDRSVAESFRAYDIAALVRANPDRYLPLLRDRVRIVVGDADNFYLNDGVRLLRESITDLTRHDASEKPAGVHPGSIRFVLGADHGTVFASPEIRGFPGEMLRHLKAAGLAD